MILLSGKSLTPARRVSVETMSLNLTERDSSATMTPSSVSGISVGSWLLDDTEPGKNIVWRVRSIRQAYATNTPTLALEHAIQMLKDRILFGEITPATITGNKKSTTCTAKQAVQYILKQQSDWVLGSFDYSVSNPYKFDGETLYDALEKVSSSLNDAQWTYDMTAYPFKLNIKPKASGVVCELRPGRNLTSITRNIDRGGMYTRFYPIGKNDLHLNGGGYVSKNEGTYGVVSRVETDSSLTTRAELTAWANERLAKHAQPVVTITADGLELADATGESLDRLRLGRMCRIPLAEYNTTFEERITELHYNDKIHAPEVVQVTLSNEREDVTKIIADAIKRGGGGRRAQERINGRYESDIDKQANKISLVVTEKNGKDVVNTSSIVLGINDQEGSYVKIKAQTINLSGYVTVAQLDATNATITNLTNGTTTAQAIYARDLHATQKFLCLGYQVKWQSFPFNGIYYDLLTKSSS